MGTGKDAMLDVQTAVVLRLRADATISSLVNGVHDYIPSNLALPYIQVGDQNETSFNTFDQQGKEIIFSITVFSEFEGFEEALTILSRINELLDFTTFTINNFNQVLIRFSDAATSRDLRERELQSNIKRVIGNYQVIVQEQ